MSISGDRTTKGKAGENGAPGEVVREILRKVTGNRAMEMEEPPPCEKVTTYITFCGPCCDAKQENGR